MGERRFDVGPGFVRAKECPDCFHTRCGEDCACNCDAAHAEVEASWFRAALDAERARVATLLEIAGRMHAKSCRCTDCEALVALARTGTP